MGRFLRDWVPGARFVELGLDRRVSIVRGDVRDQVLLERALGEYEINTVFHLAAQTIVGIANRNPVSTFETNIGGTWALLEAARRSPAVKSIVVASSDKAYGSAPKLPYTESTPLAGEHPYDVSKSCADLIAQSYARTWGLPVAITRCGNFFGGGDLNWNRIVPGTVRSLLRNELSRPGQGLAGKPEACGRGIQFLGRRAAQRARCRRCDPPPDEQRTRPRHSQRSL